LPGRGFSHRSIVSTPTDIFTHHVIKVFMRIAMMISGVAVCGAAVHCLTLTKYLVSRGHEVLLLYRPNSWVSMQPDLDNVERFETSFARRPKELIKVARRIAAFRADIIHTHMSSAHSYGMVARLFGALPVVATAHSFHFQLHWPLNHFVIATSSEASDYHRRYNLVPANAMRVIPNFIDTTRLSPATAAERHRARQALGLPPEAFVVGSVGHLIPRKRPADLVRGFAALAGAQQNALLLMVGGQSREAGNEVREAAESLGLSDRIIFAGERSDADQALVAMDVFALSSGRETGPIAVLEAMACGLPVVSTNVGTVAEFVIEGTTGFRVDVGDTAALGQRLVQLAENEPLRKALGASGREHVIRAFSIDAIAPRIEAVLEHATAVRNRPVFGFVTRKIVRQG